MENIEKDVTTWHKKTFPNATINAITDKFLEELDEFETELATGKKTDPFSATATEEFADMCIVYMSGLSKRGRPRLCELIKTKMKINKERQWGKEKANGDRPRAK